MNKDVIYIDVEDDITAIIGKVKDAKEKIVALVPPKRVGVLQSAVNLRLLSRAAAQKDKHLVLISSNSALMALAAAAKIPVAKNLQSKPELPEIAALDIDNGEDVIDGSQLPVGELAKTVPPGISIADVTDSAVDDAVRENAAEEQLAAPPGPGQLPKKPKAKSGIKVPNFNKFRKKLVLIIGSAIVLILFLIWAIFISPHATVIITARTTSTSSNARITLGSTLTTSASAGTLKTSVQQIKKDVSVSFDATGTKDIGNKAQGQIVFSNCETASPQTISAGTTLTANGLSYVTQSDATVPGGTAGNHFSCTNPGTSSPVTITASDLGDNYNTPSNTSFTVAGHDNSSFTAVASTNITGGSHQQVSVVSSDDIQKATTQLTQQNTDDVKKQLTSQFTSDYVVIGQTFNVNQGTPQASPAVGQQVASGSQAKLTSSVTYTLSGVAKSDVKQFLDGYFNQQLTNQEQQRIYDDGASGATFANIATNNANFIANLVATAKVGPKIDDTAIKNMAKGKRYGDIQSAIESIQGVDNVDVKFSPFWVSVAPMDTSKISVEFNLNG